MKTLVNSSIALLLALAPLSASGEPEPATDAHDHDDDGGSGSPDADAPLAPPLDLAPGGSLTRELLDGAKEDAAPDESVDDAEQDLGTDTVVGARGERERPGPHFDIDIGQFDVMPFKDASEMMMLAPGVLTTNHGGEGHAHETFMRGFYAGEGADIEYLVDGVPLNEVSNPHGHGYADILFLMPSLIKTVSITEGAFDPEQGDFAIAGTTAFKLAAPREGTRVELGYGEWNTRQLELVWAPKQDNEQVFAGVQVYQTDGFGQGRAAERAGVVARYAPEQRGRTRWAASVYGYGARYDQPGVVRQDDVARQKIGFYESYDLEQGGESTRFLTTVSLDAGPSSAVIQNVAWFGLRRMRLKQNFTGFTIPTFTQGDTGGIEYFGDLQESRYKVTNVGARGSFTRALRAESKAMTRQNYTLGYSARLDSGRSEIVRLRDRLSVPYQRIFDREFDIANISGYARGTNTLWDVLALTYGVRIDGYSFAVRDLNLPIEDEDGARLTEQTAQSFGLVAAPRAAATLDLTDEVELSAAYGRSARSTDASALSDNETAPFALADQGEVGVGYKSGEPGEGWLLATKASYVYAQVQRDQVFSPEAGRNILVGPSQRHAGLLNARATYERSFDAMVNLGVTHATYVPDDPTSPEFGQRTLLPYIPQFIGRLDLAYSHDFGRDVMGQPLRARIGTGFTFVPGRPLPYAERGDAFYLLNIGANATLGPVDLGVDVRNAIGLEYAQSEFNYPSRFDPTLPIPSTGSLPNMRHVVAGDPRFVMFNVTFVPSRLLGEEE